MILVDTSVWVDHFRAGDRVLEQLLDRGEVLGHPWVVGELALGQLSDRAVVLSLLRQLPRAAVATTDEILALIDAHGVFGRGIGYVDVGLLAATMLTDGARLLTADRRLQSAAVTVGCAARLST